MQDLADCQVEWFFEFQTHGRDGKRVKNETVNGRKAEKIYSAWLKDLVRLLACQWRLTVPLLLYKKFVVFLEVGF